MLYDCQAFGSIIESSSFSTDLITQFENQGHLFHKVFFLSTGLQNHADIVRYNNKYRNIFSCEQNLTKWGKLLQIENALQDTLTAVQQYHDGLRKSM